MLMTYLLSYIASTTAISCAGGTFARNESDAFLSYECPGRSSCYVNVRYEPLETNNDDPNVTLTEANVVVEKGCLNEEIEHDWEEDKVLECHAINDRIGTLTPEEIQNNYRCICYKNMCNSSKPGSSWIVFPVSIFCIFVLT